LGWTTWVMVSTAVTVWSIAVWVIRYGITRRAVFVMVLWADAAITLIAVSLHQGHVNMVSLSMFAPPSGVVALYGSGPMLGLQTMAAGIGAGVILQLQGLAAVDVAIQTGATLLATISPALAVTVLSARLVRALDRERDLSLHDPLTGVLNRRGLETEMPALLAAALAGRLWVGVVLLDIDHFKQLNDQHGHSAGDLVLQHVSDRLRAGVRE
jgi:predicted signal transduction protein with EAL and GGDEF domain